MEEIHESLELAKKSCVTFEEGVCELMMELGVFESFEDESAGVWTCAKYKDANGNTQTYYSN